MMGNDFFDLSLSVQTALGAGYIGYITAYAGFRQGHGAVDTLFISLAFASLGLLTFGLVEPHCGAVPAFVAAFLTSIVVAGLWRKWGRNFWLWLTSYLGVHREDGTHAAWAGIVQTRREVGQVSVHTKDGRVLYLNDRRNYTDVPWKGLYFGGDGSVILAVEEEELPDGTDKTCDAISDPDWGIRLTYIPASEIARVNVRLK